MSSKSKTIPSKPPSKIHKGNACSPTPMLSSNNTLHAIRDNFTLSTWLLIGAGLQSVLFLPFLRIRPSYAVAPALSLLLYRAGKGLLMCCGVIKHPYADGVIQGKKAVVFPNRVDVEGLKSDSDGSEVCVVMLFARCHSPLGLLAPQYSTLGIHMTSLIHELDASSPSNGFLGGSAFTNTCERTTVSETLSLLYFNSHASLQAFAHGPQHRAVWDWWNVLVKEGKASHLSVGHEVYTTKRGQWEGIYINQAPSLLAATHHLGEEKGEYVWKSPLVDVRGMYRSALGRMGKSNGADNEVYD